MKKHNDYIILFAALGFAFLLVYFVPQVLNKILFFIFIYLFYKSDKDYLWLAFIFIIMESPGGIFGEGLRTDQMRLPLYTLFPKFSFSFQQIFILTALIKATKKKINYNPVRFLKNNLLILLIYFIFLIFIGIGIGTSFDVGRFLYMVIFDLSLFYSVYCLFTKESDYVNFFKMLMPFGFVVLAIQLFSVGSGKPPIQLLKPNTGEFGGVYNLESGDVRPIEMTHLVVLMFFISFYFLLHKKKYFNRNLLMVLNIVLFFSIVLAATRSYFVMFVMFYLLSFMFIPLKLGNVFIRYSLIGIIAIAFLFTSDVFVEQLDRALMRISTLESVYEGDITAGGTIARYDFRAPRLMKTFYNESTIIFGAGFSELYNEKSDAHVGFHNLLFNTGIVGALLFAIFFGSVIINSFGINKKLNKNNPYKDILKVLPIAIISMMFVNTGTQFYGYDVGFNRILILVYILYFLNNQINCAMKWEEENSY